MLSSFHTHTYLCKHAEGTPLDYVQQAAEEGCSALGFSDHCPYPNDDIWLFCRMAAADIPLYKKLVDEAKKEAPFPVYFGFECEWEPQYLGWFKDTLIGTYGAEFLVLGSHWLPDGGAYEYAPAITDKRMTNRYIDFTIEAMRSGIYAFLAHPDLFLSNRTSIDSDCRAWMEALIDTAVDLQLPLEINGYGLFKTTIERDYGEDYQYPVKAFWELAAQKGARIICNSDAHQIDHVLAGARTAVRYAEQLGITVCDTAEALGFARLKPDSEH